MTICAEELITTLPSKSTSMCSVICILPICQDVVHYYLLLLGTEVILATLDSTAPIRAGVWEVVGVVLMGKTNDTFAFAWCGAQVMQGLAVLVEMAQY
jgi:hypothetical protein